MSKNYFLGLDMGTGSVGWAVTNNKYEILKAHGKALWGVRLFESACTAEERRGYRTARRRLQRRNWRIDLLQSLFYEEINKIDEGFYLRMKESRYVPEDKKDIKGCCPDLPYALFVDKDYTDKDYHKQFPTIYHLRKWLMETEETPDIRLVYLALHHMMKHRGHFLFSGNLENIKEFTGTFQNFIKCLKDEELDFYLNFEDDEICEIEKVLRDKSITKSVKKSRLIKITDAATVCEKSIFNLIVGGTVKLSDIFGDDELNESEKPKISFADSGYEDYSNSIEAALGEKYFIIEQAKAVYDWSVLVDILEDFNSISEAKIAVYEKHKADLKYLKDIVRNNMDKNVYNDIFVKTDEKTANYSAYIGMTKHNGKKSEIEGKICSKKDFYDYLKKKILNVMPDNKELEYLRQEIDKGTFMPKLAVSDNGVLPYQVHLYELDSIFNNLCERIPLLKENREKIRRIFTFRIPYYVGALNGVEKKGVTTNWAVRKSPGKIYPWNFEEIIDEEASAEQFIRRMTNKCTYLYHEDVLPKNSMLYSKFMVLNELNNVRINGDLISVELKQKIYEELFERYRKVTQKKLKNFLIHEGITDKNVDITGIDADFKGSLTAYHDFKEKLTGCELSDNDKENIILNITLFGDDKKLLNRRLSKLYPMLSDKQIKSLCSLTYKGWGRLSKMFLDGITAVIPETGEISSIIHAMWETNDNLMQILSEKYDFTEAIEKENGNNEISEFSYKIVDDMSVSPSVKRQVWQTLQIVHEICKVMGEPPKRVFVEMAREKVENKKRTESRKKKLIDLYKQCKHEEREWISELENTEEQKLRGDKLYLYYTQKGRCMYSGEVIDLNELWDNRKYDIDHIYPQSKVMDDSLDNRVLVKKIYNAEKTDEYPIKEEIRKTMQPFWKMLSDGGFISKEKYKRLVRSNEFEPHELAGFIERQLVETRQGTKAVASVLKQILPDSEIIYAKARNTSQFRQDFDLIKVRDMNDLHHAKDAYLNIVVGNVYYVKFTKNASWFIRENPGRSYNIKTMFISKHNIERNGETAWVAGDNGSISTVKKFMNKNNIMVTRRSYKVKGGLFDRQLMKKGKGQVPIKGNDERLQNISKYGGYNKATGTYFVLVESEGKKGNKKRTIEYIPLYLQERFEKSNEEMLAYLSKDRELQQPKILIPEIKIDTLFELDGFRMYLSGRTGNQLIFKGANQLILSQECTNILKKVIKFVNRRKENKELNIVASDGIKEDDLCKLYDVFLDKIKNTVYHSRLAAQEKTLTEKRDVFVKLGVEDKCIVLAEILHMFQCNSSSANLKLIGGPGNAGILVLNNDISKCSNIAIINQSITGVYEQKIDLKQI